MASPLTFGLAGKSKPTQPSLTGKVFQLMAHSRVDIIRSRGEHLGVVRLPTNKRLSRKRLSYSTFLRSGEIGSPSRR
jgi:hypothetical protein